jgi:hypothetical protein
MPPTASMRRIAAFGSLIAVIGIPTTTLAQAASQEPAELDALAAVALMNEVPSDIRASCMPSDAVVDGAVASAQCLHEGGVVLYIRFADVPALQAGYDQVASLTGLAPDTGTACADGAFEGEYTDAAGTVPGRLACQTGPDGAIAVWTDGDRIVLGLVQVPGSDDFAALESAWLAARLDADAAPASGTPESMSPTLPPAGPVSSAPAPSSPSATGPTTAAVPSLPAGTLNQWAISATASSEYGSDAWSAQQATGAPDTTQYGDFVTAWAPSGQDIGAAWLELTYETPVIPAEVVIWETSGNGFVTRVQAWDEASGAWVTLWEGEDGSPEFVVGFSPDLTPVTFATQRLRMDIDTDMPGWNEVDAVALIGTAADGT